MLTADELTEMRATTLGALPDQAVIENQTFVSDGGGGGSLTWMAAGTVACRLAPIGGNEAVSGGAVSPDSTSYVTLPASVSVGTTSRLRISGGTFSVTAIRARSWNLTTRVEVKKL